MSEWLYIGAPLSERPHVRKPLGGSAITWESLYVRVSLCGSKFTSERLCTSDPLYIGAALYGSAFT